MKKEPNDHAATSNGKSLTSSGRFLVFWLTFALVVLSWMSIKIVLPALPGLPDIFDCTSDGVKLSVSLYLIFYALSQPVWGGVVQKTSCRKALFYSLFVVVIGSLIAMFSVNLPMYIIGRTLEGIGMGAGGPIGRTLLTNVYTRKELAHRIGLISGVAAAMPAVAPIIGGYLLTWINWRAIFGFMFLITVIYFYFAYRWLPVTRIKSANEGVITTRKLLGIYFAILRDTAFWGYALTYALIIGGLLGYYSAMPYWYHSQLGIPEHTFAYLAIPTVGMYIAGLIFAGYLIKKHDLEEVLFFGIILACATGLIAILLVFLKVSVVPGIVVVMSLYGFSGGLVAPNANAGVLDKFRKVAAPTSALVAVIIFGTASLTSAITMNLFIKDTLWPVVIYLLILSFIGLAAGYFWVWLPNRNTRTGKL